ncbi:MAG: HD domain-containing protein [Acidimicrobiia bacterium]|nr:HD domain-containing protein [Acidimicrobiia bacterium]
MHRLMRVLAATDPALAEHGNRTAHLATEVAVRMGMARDYVERIGAAGRYHDIGKLFISREILDKPGPPTKREWVELRRHPRIGFELIRKRVPAPIAKIVLTHHERVDGQGYPGGISGREIPIEARVLQVADAFDAITSQRPYQPALPVAYAVDELKKYAGTQFDPDAVNGILELVEDPRWADAGSGSRLRDGIAV